MANKKTKEDWKKEGDELKKVFAAAKKKQHNCAVFIAAEGMVIEADPRLPPGNLDKKARKRDGATPKGVTGTLKVNGSNLEITCLEEPPGGIQTKLKQYLTKVGLKLKPIIIPPATDEAPVEEEAPAEKPVAKEEEAEGDIGEILAKARKKPHNVAWLIGDKGLVLKAHPKLPIDKLRQQAKSEGGGQRGALGVMTISGKTVLLTCEEEPPKSFPRLAKTWMADQGHVYKVKVALPDGGELIDGEDDEEEAEPAAEQTAEPELSKEKLTEDLKHVSEIFKLSFDGMDNKQADELKSALKSIAGSVSSGDLVGAQNMLNKLGLLTGVTPDSPMQPITMAAPEEDKKGGDGDADPAELRKRKKELIDAFAKIKPDLQKTLADAEGEAKNELKQLIASFGEQTKADEFEDAQESLDAIQAKMEAVTIRLRRKSDLDDLEQRIDALISSADGLDSLR